ncbi:50S ribosomal protein L9 [Candidatus Arthromitus sp. SFB-rat-Yit]|uniref:50S ribosomal protein L9 n=1 Tax=Candidatus Arthromitus sp. SFB-rat-Yit TaxID=1041504 RepID=UPI000227A12F|nr:50S ribosomal protein L9 [Candidatus Arthromitus sp. SFB-rat-Yit]BAK81878.1 50S ribosomal protein L9 [Candidatus Arthromitus sp. SFB-rat-Yit]
MKVILTNDIKNVGKKNDLIEVSDGYARNFLFPKKLAIEANDANLNTLNYNKEIERQERIKKIEEFQEIANKLRGKEIIITTKLGTNGKLFGSITSKDICNKINSQFKLNIDKKKISFEQIKSLGNYPISIKLCPEVSVNMVLKVTSD